MPLSPLKEPKSKLARISDFIRGTIASSILFSTLIVINGLQMASLIIKPFSLKAFRSINRWCANTWWVLCDEFAKNIYRINITQNGDDIPEGENSIVITNHQEMADIPVLFSLARTKKRLGDYKWFVKDIIKYVPGVGWGMLFLDCLFIKRNWTNDRDYINNVFKKILNHRVPVWIISFVEGTRIRPYKLKRAQNYAKEKGFNPPKHVLIPRTKGFTATVQALRDHIDAVYDVTIGYVEGVPTLWQWTKGQVKRVNLHVRRYSINDLPQDNEDLSLWLIKRFEEKDSLLEYYYNHGAFPNCRSL